MIKSFCIKSNNKDILNYLLGSFKGSSPDDFYLSKCKFKVYNNIILHYTGNDESVFYTYVSSLIQHSILRFYEPKLIRNIINFDYFYFSDTEKDEIFELTQEILAEPSSLATSRLNVLYHLCYKYVENNKSMILDGFINFRLKEYTSLLSDIVSEAASAFTIQKEYDEFIDLLSSYVASNKPTVKEVHLVYFNNDSLLLDENKNIIKVDKNISTAKYLSDITFSSNDYCLNTLLNILPKKIFVHLLNVDDDDEFLDTLCAIFGKRIIICLDSEICGFYKSNDIKQK